MREAFLGTCKKRNTEYLFQEGASILDEILVNPIMKRSWINYQKKFAYAQNITFEETLNATRELLYKINNV